MLFSVLSLQREYEEYKVRINALVAKAQKTPEEGWTMQDGTSWPGNNTRDHPGMIQVKFILCDTSLFSNDFIILICCGVLSFYMSISCYIWS